jgi:Protein of unknown function (DUF1573)
MNKLFLGTIALMFFAAAALMAQPKLEIVGGSTYNWGDVNEKDNPLKGTVVFKNVGNDTLIIKNVKPTCGCTTAPLKKDELAPGEETTIDITLKLSSKRGGPVTKSIKITTNDPDNPLQTLLLKANVFQPLELKPKKYLVFDGLQVGSSSKTTVSLFNNTDKPIKVTKFDVKPVDLETNLHKDQVIAPGKSIDITAYARPKKKGYFNCSIILHTDHPDYPKYTINGYGAVKVKESPVFNESD